MDNKTANKKLFKIVQMQQKILEKMAQALPPQQHLDVAKVPKTEAAIILDALPLELKNAIYEKGGLEVQLDTIKVHFKPGQGNQAREESFKQVVSNLQNASPPQLRKMSPYKFQFLYDD